MKALGDETRLKILRCIYKKINSTQAIARDLVMTEAGVSKHLKLMYEALENNTAVPIYYFEKR
jgi:DNA-binding transcriptional ArsR family regulator